VIADLQRSGVAQRREWNRFGAVAIVEPQLEDAQIRRCILRDLRRAKLLAARKRAGDAVGVLGDVEVRDDVPAGLTMTPLPAAGKRCARPPPYTLVTTAMLTSAG